MFGRRVTLSLLFASLRRPERFHFFPRTLLTAPKRAVSLVVQPTQCPIGSLVRQRRQAGRSIQDTERSEAKGIGREQERERARDEREKRDMDVIERDVIPTLNHHYIGQQHYICFNMNTC